jgi:PAS domain S-box-containing protein
MEMVVPLHLLIIEDSSDDAQLMVRTIERGGYHIDYERVQTEAELKHALDNDKWDMALCDYTLPAFNAIRALEIVRASDKDLPFIIVSGSISEEMAVTALRGGAHDFMLKGNMARLVPAIHRELEEAQTRRERRRAEAETRKAISFFEAVVETANVIYLQMNLAGTVVKINSAAEEITGYMRAELEGRNWAERVLPRDRYPQPWKEFERITTGAGAPGTFENPILTKRGEERFILWKNSVIREGDHILGTISFGIDITDRKQAQAALREAETRYRLLVERMPTITYVVSSQPPYRTLYISPQVEKILGFTPEEWRADPDLWEKQIHPDDRDRVLEEDRASREEKRPFLAEYRVFTRDGRVIWLHDETHHINEPGMEPFSQGIELDITERKLAEEVVRETESRYRALVEQLPMVVYVNPITEPGHTTYVSPQVQAVFGYTREEWLSDPQFWTKTLHPDDHDKVMEEIARVNATGSNFDMEYRTIARDGRLVWIRDQAVRVNDASGRPSQWHGLMIDISEPKRRQREWEALAQLSNALRQAQTVEEVLPRLLEETLSLLDTEAGSIWLQDPVSGRVEMAVERQWSGVPLEAYTRGDNIPDIVIDTGQPIVGREFRSDPRIPASHRLHIPPGMGGACVPLTAAGKTVGALLVNIRAPRELDAGELRVLNALANLGASSIHRAQLFEETVKHLDRLAALRSIDIAISSSFDLRMVLSVVLDNVIKELNADAASVLLLRPDSLMLEFAAGKGFWTRSIESSLLPATEGLLGRSVIDRNITYIDDLRTTRQAIRRPFLLTDEKFVSYYGVPLIAKGTVKGVLEIFHRAPLAHDAEWLQFLESLASQTAIAIDSSVTFQDLQRSNMELALAYDATIEGWSHALDLRDRETEGHTLRVTGMALRLARAMGLGDEALLQLRRGGLLHDIGKMGVPDSILLKPGRLTDEEWVIMRKHPVFAYDMLSPIAYLRPALDVPYCHHERWDGNGYPRGLRGEQIPLTARIFAVVDVWDALSSDRPYRPAWKSEDVLKYIRDEAGKQFDPAVVEVFLNLIPMQAGNSSPG